MTTVLERSPTQLAVAGISFVHHAQLPVVAPEWIVPSWTGSRVVDDPVTVYHRIGAASTEGLRLLRKTPLPHGDYYVDGAGHLAVRFPGHPESGLKPHLLRTVRKGFEYELLYESPSDAHRLQREWHRTLLMFTLPFRERGLAVHATGFTLEGGLGVVCPGVSGAGKSTLAKMLLSGGGEKPTLLSDDRVAVTADSSGLRVWGTPWQSSARVASPHDAPCRAMVFVGRGDGARLRTITPAAAAKRLLRTVAIPFWDRAGTDFALSFVERMVSSLPSLEFEYRPSPSAATTLISDLSALLAKV